MGVFVVTGGASGIRAATAARLRGNGHEVITAGLVQRTITADPATEKALVLRPSRAFS